MSTPDYSVNDPKGWCGDPSRGAALGRPSIREVSADYTGRIVLSRVYIDTDGYDRNGTYFGIGEPLFWYANEEGTIDVVMRAADSDTARMTVQMLYPSAKVEFPASIDGIDLDAFVASYVETALWSSNDNADPETGGEPMDANYSVEDIDEKTIAAFRRDCERFLQENAADIAAALEHQDEGHIAHDFWLTRNHHGAGFWDGDYPSDLGKRLTDAAQDFNETDLYVGDDGVIYAMGEES